MMTINEFKTWIEFLRNQATRALWWDRPLNAEDFGKLADALECEFWDRMARDRFSPAEAELITTIKGIRENHTYSWEYVSTLLQAWLLERKVQEMTYAHEKRIAGRWRFCTTHGFPMPYLDGCPENRMQSRYVMHVGMRRVIGSTPDECVTLAMGQTTPMAETVFDAQARNRDAIRNGTKY